MHLFLPLQFRDLTEQDLQSHLRHCASTLPDQGRVEVLLCEAQIVVAIVKRIYRTRPPVLELQIRSGSVSRARLGDLRDRLLADNYSLKLPLTSKLKLLRRVIVCLPVEGGTVAITGLNVIRTILSEFGIPPPYTFAVGYGIDADVVSLPGRIESSNPPFNLGFKIGKLVRKILSKI